MNNLTEKAEIDAYIYVLELLKHELVRHQNYIEAGMVRDEIQKYLKWYNHEPKTN